LNHAHLGENFQTSLAVAGVDKENSDILMLPAFTILENCCFSAFSDLQYMENR